LNIISLNPQLQNVINQSAHSQTKKKKNKKGNESLNKGSWPQDRTKHRRKSESRISIGFTAMKRKQANFVASRKTGLKEL
jgi:hypothetical protein